jgi:hypothetical protein
MNDSVELQSRAKYRPIGGGQLQSYPNLEKNHKSAVNEFEENYKKWIRLITKQQKKVRKSLLSKSEW